MSWSSIINTRYTKREAGPLLFVYCDACGSLVGVERESERNNEEVLCKECL